MAKAASTAEVLRVDSATQTIEVRVLHTDYASYARSVQPAAWKAAKAAATAARFAGRVATQGAMQHDAREGDLCVTRIAYRFA